MKQQVLFLFLMINNFLSIGQVPNSKTIADFKKIREKAEEIAIMDPDSAQKLAKKLMLMAQKIKNDQYIANAMSTTALANLWQSNFDEAIANNKKSELINEKLNNEAELASNYFIYGKINQNKSEFVEATKYFLKSSDLAFKSKLYSLTQKNYRSISNIYLQQENYPKSREYGMKALALESKFPNELDRADGFLILAPYYELTGKVDSAEMYYDKAYLLYKKLNLKFKMAHALNEKSILYGITDPIKSIELELEGQAFLDKVAPEHILSIGNIGNIGEGFFVLAQNDSLIRLLKNKNLPKTKAAILIEAEKYMTRCIALSAKKKNPRMELYYYGLLSSLNAYNGNYKSAYENLKINKNFGDSLFSQKNKNAIAKLESEKEILNLNASNKQKTTNNKILIGLFSGLSILSLLGFRNFKNRQKIQQLKITELEKDKQLLAVDAMLKGQEEERNRIAKDLHDGLGGMLSGVKMSITNMKENMIMTAENVTVFEQSIGQLDGTIAELRKIAHNLMPEALVKFGLSDAINDYCTSLKQSTNIAITYESLGDNRKLDNTANTYIYRIVQELINNAVKHGKPNTIFVQMTTTPSKILLTVEDNGLGLDTNKMIGSTGIGISNIKHRVNYFKGSIAFENNVPQGTVVNIELNI
jgi:two-component system, NarL family, sensor kinase